MGYFKNTFESIFQPENITTADRYRIARGTFHAIAAFAFVGLGIELATGDQENAAVPVIIGTCFEGLAWAVHRELRIHEASPDSNKPH